MNHPSEDKKTNIILAALGVIPVVWAALMVAPFLSDGLAGIIEGFTSGMADPMKVKWCVDSLKAILIFLLIYGLGIGVYLSTKRNYRKGEEHGSAKWGNASQLSKKYADKNKYENIILTQNTRIGLDGRKHRRNLNVLVCGGSGAGKTRFYAKPNIMQANTSFVVLDTKGEILRDTGFMLEKEGYEIRVLDLINTERSHGYNPFVYLRDDKDILKLVANLVRNTTPKGAQSNDPFWERAETALLEALILYLVNEAPPEEQNFPMVMEMISAAEVKEEDEGYTSILDELFNALELRNPDHLALKQYRIFKMAAGKTAKSILISLGVRLEKFNLPQIASVVIHDELNLPSLGDKKTALFAVIPDNDSSLNYIIGMMYTQLFQELLIKSYISDHKGVLGAKERMYGAFEDFWKEAAPAVNSVHTDMGIAEFAIKYTNLLAETLEPLGILDQFQCQGVFANWWEHSYTVREYTEIEQSVEGKETKVDVKEVIRIKNVFKTINSEGFVASLVSDDKIASEHFADELEELRSLRDDAENAQADLMAYVASIEMETDDDDSEYGDEEKEPKDPSVKEVETYLKNLGTDEAKASLKQIAALKKEKNRLNREVKKKESELQKKIDAIREELTEEQCEDLVMRLLHDGFVEELDAYLSAEVQKTIRAVNKLWEKYHVSVTTLLEAEESRG